MKKHIQKIVAVVLLMTLFCNNAIVVKAESSESKVIVNNETKQVFNDYFAVRENAFYAGNNSRARSSSEVYNNLLVESEVLAVEAVRNKGIEDYINACDIEVVNVTTSYSVGKCESISACRNTKYRNEVEYSVYEWTWIEYTADGKTIENMGMGTEHKITVAFDGENYVIISDEYDESDISGVCTLEEVYVENTEEEIDIEAFKQDRDIESRSFFNSQRELDINAFIEYADAWVYHSPATSGEMYPEYYNPAYCYYYDNNKKEGVDCTNYASQCLHAAGMAFDTSGTATWWANITTNATPQQGDGSESALAWRSIGSFEPYWVVAQGYEEVDYNTENLTPGCVAINLDEMGKKTHVMVCVGYNRVGTPILNGHTNDRYHILNFKNARYIIKFTYESPASYITLSSSTTQQSGTINSAGTKYYYKFVPASTGFYDIYTESSIDTIGSIYKEDIIVMNGTSYGVMNEVNDDDNGNDGSDFWMMPYLTAGVTYYIEVSASSTGSYVLHIE